MILKNGLSSEVWGLILKKCYILSICQKSFHFYQLDGEILQQVNSNPYLRHTLSEDLQWKTHIQYSSNCQLSCMNISFFPLNKASKLAGITWEFSCELREIFLRNLRMVMRDAWSLLHLPEDRSFQENFAHETTDTFVLCGSRMNPACVWHEK